MATHLTVDILDDNDHVWPATSWWLYKSPMPTTSRQTSPNSITQPSLRKIKPLGFVIFSNLVTDAGEPTPTNAGPFTFENRCGNVDNAFRINGKCSLCVRLVGSVAKSAITTFYSSSFSTKAVHYSTPTLWF